MDNELVDKMIFIKNGKQRLPLFVAKVNGRFIVAAYQGSLSLRDILIKYRKKSGKDKWSRIRTPKHIHWAVDVLIKMNETKRLTQEFLNFLLRVWRRTEPFSSKKQREKMLSASKLLRIKPAEAVKFEGLGEKGEYSINFLIMLARLLMLQEKTNRRDAYMFKELLEALKEGKDIFAIVSKASHTGR